MQLTFIEWYTEENMLSLEGYEMNFQEFCVKQNTGSTREKNNKTKLKKKKEQN